MAHQNMPKILHDLHKNPLAPPPTYLMYGPLCVPDVVKNLNLKVFNLISRTNDTRYIEWHETCKCKCRLDLRVCNNKQR